MFPQIALGILSGAGNIFNSVENIALADEQAGRSKELKNEAATLAKNPLRPEFRDAERMREMAYLTGMPGMKQYKDGFLTNYATAAAKGREGATTGGDYLNYLNAIYGSTNDKFQELFAQDAAYKAQSAEQLAQTKWAIGQEELRNEEIKRQQQDELYKQANDLESAATQNKQLGVRGLFGAAMGLGGNMLGSAAGEGLFNKDDNDYKSFFDDAGTGDHTSPFGDAEHGTTSHDPSSSQSRMSAFGGTFMSPEDYTSAADILSKTGFSPTGSETDIKHVQSFLKGAGLYSGNIDGKWGPMTAAGMQSYLQQKNQQYAPYDNLEYYYQSFVRPSQQ